MATPPVDIKRLDALQAQISVSISQARSLVDSWLPLAPSTAGQSTPLYSTLPDDELFEPKPPRLGLGAPIPKHFYDDDQKLRKDISSVDLLKRRLLGSKRNASQMSDKPTQHKARYRNRNSSRVESESEEEEGRSALGKPKRPKVEAEKVQERGDGKQKGEDCKVEVEASSGPGRADEKKDPEREQEDKPKASQSHPAAPKLQTLNRGDDANESGKKKKKKNRKQNRGKLDSGS